MSRAAWMRLSLVLGCLTLSGCVRYQSERERVNAEIPDTRALQKITPGETTADWLLAEFGQPSAVHRPGGNIAIWQYQNVSHSRTRVRALPLFAVELHDQARTVYHFEIENNYVVRFWKDAAE